MPRFESQVDSSARGVYKRFVPMAFLMKVLVYVPTSSVLKPLDSVRLARVLQ